MVKGDFVMKKYLLAIIGGVGLVAAISLLLNSPQGLAGFDEVGGTKMSKENINTVVEWFTATWTNRGYNPDTLRKLASKDLIFKYPLHGERKGVEEMIKALDTLYASFPDLDFHVVGDPIADGKYVAAKWHGGGTHTGVAFSDNPLKIEIPANSGKKIEFGGTTIFVVENGKVVSEVGQEEAIDVAFQLGLIKPVNPNPK